LSYENGSQCAYAYEINDDLSSLAETFVGSSVSFNFDYNKVHQQIGLAVDDSAFLWTPQLSSVTNYANANDLNQYPAVDATGYAYNNNGCLTGGLLTAGFDALNRMTQAVSGLVTNDYVYDPVNRQAQKAVDSVKTGFLYDGQQLIEEYDDAGDLACRYIRGNRLDEVFIKVAGSTKTYLHHDRLGSVIALSDDSGALLQACSYSPFGQTASLAGTAFGFTGQRFDSEVGLYNYKARVYAPAIGRFLQPDPIGFDGGDLNLYSYVQNDSSNLTDPSGLDPWHNQPTMQNVPPVNPWIEGAYQFAQGFSDSKPFGRFNWNQPFHPAYNWGESIGEAVKTASLGLANAAATSPKMINLFGEGEATATGPFADKVKRTFQDYVPPGTPENWINGRPSTGNLMAGTASDIFVRNAPITEATAAEIARLSGPGTKVTVLGPSTEGGYVWSGNAMNGVGNATSTVGPLNFISQYILPGVQMTIGKWRF